MRIERVEAKIQHDYKCWPESLQWQFHCLGLSHGQRFISNWEEVSDESARGRISRLNYSTAALSVRFFLQRHLLWKSVFVWDCVWVQASQRQRALSPTRQHLASYPTDELIRRTAFIFNKYFLYSRGYTQVICITLYQMLAGFLFCM